MLRNRRWREMNDKNRGLKFKQDGQDYAQVVSMPGEGRWFEAMCSDGIKRIFRLRGKMAMNILIDIGDILLVSFRDFPDHKTDVILKYFEHEISLLIQIGELPAHMCPNVGPSGGHDGDDNDIGGHYIHFMPEVQRSWKEAEDLANETS